MKKVRLEIVGLSYSQTQSGAYALVWHRPLVDVALYVIILGIVVYLSIWFTK